MGYLGTIMQAGRAAIGAFRESMLSADPQGGRHGTADFDAWDRWGSRQARYALNWAQYQNTAYRESVQRLAAAWKASRGLYKHTRHLYNPAYRLGEFWAGHLMGGTLDRDAGDGESAPSALPILTDRAAIRPALARLWADSRWQVGKETYARWGSVLGDVALKVVDDTVRGQARLELVHPGHLRHVEFDPLGNVRGYVLERRQADPRRARDPYGPGADVQGGDPPVAYREVAYRDGPRVVFRTYLDGKPFAWNGVEDAWDEPYGFVPLVVVAHESIGLEWGMNAWGAGQGDAFTEVDDQASGLSDQIRKAIRAPILLGGVTPPKDRDLKAGGREPTPGNPEPSRSESPFLYGPVDATATHLTFNLKIVEVCEHIRDLIAGIEKNFPELLADAGNLGGTVTAEAIRNARQRASSKVQARRVPYDAGLVAAHKMALSIGGMRGYRGYEAFGPGSFEAGELDHSIGHRPVFEVDPLDSIEEDQAFWTAAGLAVKAGVPLVVYLERNGWSAEELATLTRAKDAEAAKAQAAAASASADPAQEPGSAPAEGEQG